MQKQKFNPLFYSLLIYRVGGRARVTAPTAAPQAALSVGVADRNEAKKSVGHMNQLVKNQLGSSYVELGHMFINPKQKAEIMKIRNERANIYQKFLERIRICDVKDIKKIRNVILNKLRKLATRAKEMVELMRDRDRMIEALPRQAAEVKKEFLSKLPTYQNIEKKHLLMVLNSYLARWKKANKNGLKGASIQTIKLLRSQFNNAKGLFYRGRIHEDLQTIRTRIQKIVDLWQDNTPRRVYESSKWDTNYEKMIDKKARKRAIKRKSWYQGFPSKEDLAKAKKELREEYPPPLPDWGGKGKDPIESPLSNDEWPDYLKELEAGYTSLEALGKLQQHARNFKDSLNKVRSKLVFGNVVPTKKGDAARFSILDKQNKKPVGHIELNNKGQISLSLRTLTKPEAITIAEAKSPEKLMKKIETLAFKPVVKSADINASNKEVIVKGENLPQTSIKVDVTKGWLTLCKPLGAGISKVSLLQNLGKLGDNLKKILTQAIQRGIKEPPKGLKKMVMDKLPGKKVDELQKEVFEKTKPKIVVWGKASMEGSLARNKKIAKARAVSAAKAIKTKNPGVKVETRGRVYGPDMMEIKDSSTLKSAEENLVKKWNAVVNPTTHVAKAKEIYAKLSKPANQKEKDFIQTHFNNVRGSTMTVEYAKQKPPLVALRYEKAPATV